MRHLYNYEYFIKLKQIKENNGFSFYNKKSKAKKKTTGIKSSLFKAFAFKCKKFLRKQKKKNKNLFNSSDKENKKF